MPDDGRPVAALGQQLCGHRCHRPAQRAAPGNAQYGAGIGPARWRDDGGIVLMGLQILDQRSDRPRHPFQLLGRQHLAGCVGIGQRHRRDRDLVIISRERLILQQRFGLLQHLVRVPGQHPLVKALNRGQRRPIPQQHIKKLQPLHMPPEHDHAERQRGGQDQTNRPPQPGPENRGNNHRYRGQAGRMAIDQRLHPVPHQRLGQQEQRGGPDRQRPAGINRRCQQQWWNRRQKCPDIGYKPQQPGQYSPQPRAGNAEPIEPNSDHPAKQRIEHQLRQEIARQPGGGLVHGDGRPVQVGRPGKPDDPVPQILLLG